VSPKTEERVKKLLMQVSLRNDYTVYEEGGAYLVTGENRRGSATSAGSVARRSPTCENGRRGGASQSNIRLCKGRPTSMGPLEEVFVDSARLRGGAWFDVVMVEY
jgi:hypothetical protein